VNLPDVDASHRALHVLAACVGAVAVVAMLTAFHEPPPPRRLPRHEDTPWTGAVEDAPTYARLRERLHTNRLRHAGNLTAMEGNRPALTDTPAAVTDTARAAALARRAERRAYDGAPPTIPHPIAQMASPNCLTCHARGMNIGTRTAPAICHEVHASCTQCHVVSERPMPSTALEGGPPFADNSFVGLEAPTHGERASPVAPPTIPHATRMRSECRSCHGVLAEGLRTSHPWRESCVQCHAPSAALDQRPVGESAF
jgi:cytochrome c-type protein NapB